MGLSSRAHGIPNLITSLFERCRFFLPAFPLTFSEFLGWAVPKAIRNLLSGVHLAEATGSVTHLRDLGFREKTLAGEWGGRGGWRGCIGVLYCNAG